MIFITFTAVWHVGAGSLHGTAQGCGPVTAKACQPNCDMSDA